MKTARTSEGGSRTLLYAALAPTAEEQASGVSIDVMRGGYISSNIVQRPSRWVESEEGKKVQELVWVSPPCFYMKLPLIIAFNLRELG